MQLTGWRIGVCLWLLTALIPAVPARGADPELVTDRPDQTESSVVIEPGHVQIETGWTHSENDDDGEDVVTDEFPGTLIRVGVVERLELRFGFAGYIWEDVDAGDGEGGRDDGFGDTEIGAKVYLWEERGLIPEAALLTHLSLPTGEDGFSTERADPSFRFNFAHTLSERFSFSYNLGAAWETEEDDDGGRDTLSVFQYTASLGIGLTERLGCFVELFGDVPFNASGGPAHSFDGGFTYLLLDNLQLDASAGAGLSDAADDWFVGTGLSVRF